MMTDIAMLLNYHGNIDLIETSCSHNTLLTQVARLNGMTTERWKMDDYDLSTDSGLAEAEQRLRSLRPRRLWLSPEHGPVVPEQWHGCMHLAWVQADMNGYFYIEQPENCVTWHLKDTLTRYVLDARSSRCIRDLCFDGMKHPRSGKPLQRSTRIQSNDASFVWYFGQGCVGHDMDHARAGGKQTSYGTSVYPTPFCQRVLQLWKSEDDKTTPKGFVKKLRDARQNEQVNPRCGTCGSSSLSSPSGCEKCSDDSALPAVAEIMQDMPEDDDGKQEQQSEQKLMRLHKNLGHPSNRLLTQILKEAKAPVSIQELASQIHCPICERHVRTSPARPANPHRARELGQIVAMDLSFHSTPRNEKLMILHLIDEASRYHTAKIIKEDDRCHNFSELGNCHAEELIDAIAEWARYMAHPSCFHVDEEGCFHSDRFKEYCGVKSIEVKMAAGEAHWQNGIVERHIGTFRTLFSKLLLDDTYEGATNQSIVDATCEAKNNHGSYNGTSPIQWFVGRSRHPLVETSDVSPALAPGTEFEQHLMRKVKAAQEFHAADARNILKMASTARSRVLSDVHAGQTVYYFRRGKKKEDRGYRGPAKVIAVERGQGPAPIVAWLSHAGTLIRAAP